MNRPIGYIGSYSNTFAAIEKYKTDSYLIYEINHENSMEDIKNFRLWLLQEQIKPKLGVIHFLNRFTNAQKAVLLKIFEELPQFSNVVFSATSCVDAVISSRSNIIYLSSFCSDKIIEKASEKILDSMKSRIFSDEIKKAWYVLLNTMAMYEDCVISQEEKDLICNSMGL